LEKVVKLHFPTAGSSMTPPHEGPGFTFKDYAPGVFRALRPIFGVDCAEYMVFVVPSFFLVFISYVFYFLFYMFFIFIFLLCNLCSQGRRL
jgi:hypothetical protein